jgi:NAD-dependent SIR2 family protein deacetylase
MNTLQIPAGLAAAVRDRKAVLFAGAGISYNALKVGGLELRNWIGAEIRKDHPQYDFTNRSLEDVCDEFAVLHDRPRLVDFLAGQIPQNVNPLPGHIAAVHAFRFIITTNWDLLFEAAYRSIGQRYQLLTEEVDSPMFNYDQHNLLKIHGSIDRPRSLICTTEDYEGYADTHPQLMDRIGDLIYSNTVLFIGHGLRDEHLRRLLFQIRRKRGDLQRRHYVVGFYDEVRTRLLESRKMEVIQDDADHFLPELTNATKPA